MIQRAGKLGLGTAYIEGFRFALTKGYDYILEMDADFSHDPRDLQRLYFACSEGGFDLSVGSRYSSGVNVVNWPMRRVLLSFFASRYVRIVTGIPLHDTTAGFVCYKRQVLEKIPLDKVKLCGLCFPDRNEIPCVGNTDSNLRRYLSCLPIAPSANQRCQSGFLKKDS